MNEINRKRIEMLEFSLSLENATSFLLGVIFDRRDYRNTRSFGNKSTAFTFNQKIQLLLDYNVVESTEKVKFELVMLIRNQFLHNIDCSSYQDAFNAVNGYENKVKTLYPVLFELGDNEKSLELGVKCAFEDCIEIITNAKNKGNLYEKFNLEADRLAYMKIFESVQKKVYQGVIEFRVELYNDQIDYTNKDKLYERVQQLAIGIFDSDEFENENPQ